ncbi:hypothetical protein H2248_006106 [Termitomyces sp. 'cryptogamus']|nr:hypothetical protein H2248_006106 [Termitomyces sp. 'cryptogamus']
MIVSPHQVPATLLMLATLAALSFALNKVGYAAIVVEGGIIVGVVGIVVGVIKLVSGIFVEVSGATEGAAEVKASDGPSSQFLSNTMSKIESPLFTTTRMPF